MRNKFTGAAGIILAVLMVLYVSCGEEAEKFSIDSSGPFENGSISVQKEAAKGDTVTVKAQPDEYFGFSSLSVKGTKNGNDITVSGTGKERTFIMPGEPVKITAVFLEERMININRQYHHGDVFGEDGESKTLFAIAGEIITIIGVPHEGYYLHTLRVVKRDSQEEILVSPVQGNINARTFIMVDETVDIPEGGNPDINNDGAIFKPLSP